MSQISESFYLVAVNQLGPSTLILDYSRYPKASSATIADDALNKLNYNIVGPGSNSIINVEVVSGRPQSVKLTTASALNPGPWTITVTNVRTPFDLNLEDPVSLDFTVLVARPIPAISGGAENDSSEALIRRHLSPALKGKNWDALIAAIATGDTYLKELAQLAFKQLFKSTASGKYLDRKLSDDGFLRPAGVGVSDEVFRKLGIRIGAEKITIQSFLQVLEAYYGSDAIRANSDSITETYNIQEGDSLIVDIDGTIVTVVFHANDFNQIGFATAEEVAAAITRAFRRVKVTAYAISVKDVLLNSNKIRIYSGALGLKGYVRVRGGKAQNVLQFPTELATTQANTTQWSVITPFPAPTPSLAANRARIKWSGVGTNPSLYLLEAGNYVNIYGTQFSANNRGTFPVVAVVVVSPTEEYFEIENPIAVEQVGPVIQTTRNDITFFRPVKKTVNSNTRITLAAQGSTEYTDVILAATTQAVSRTINTGAYLHSNPPISFLNKSDCVSVERTTNVTEIVTVTDHGLITGDTFYLAPGDPNIGKSFISGVYTATVVNSTTITYVDTGPDAVAQLPQSIYPCYREANGTVTIKTTAPHGVADGHFILIENLKDPALSAPIPYFLLSNTGLPVTGYLDYSAAVQLQDGKVLNTGGTDGTEQVFVNLYDPETNLWSAAADMSVARQKHTATTLLNGRVLVTGGNAGLDTTEIYDQDSNVWIPSATMNAVRFAHTATLMNDGKVLVVGGGSATAEMFDPGTGIWTSVASPSVDRKHAQAVKLGDGRVLVMGGYTTFPTALNSAEIYNPNNDTWTSVPNMTTARFYHQAINTPSIGSSGKVIVIGGSNNGTSNSLASVEIYNPALNTWTSGASMAQSRYNHSINLLSNGRIMVYAGQSNATTALTDVSIYDQINNTWFNSVAVSSNGASTQKTFLLSNNKVISTPTDFDDGEPILYNNQVDIAAAGGANGTFVIDVGADLSKFTYQTTESSMFTNPTPFETNYLNNEGLEQNAFGYEVAAAEDEDHIGPYIYDTESGPAFTATQTFTNQDIIEGEGYASLAVVNASEFPEDGGYLVFDFGYENQVFPVRYTFRATDTLLLLDSNFIFPVNIPSGTKINLLYTRGIWNPANPTELGSFYLTDSVSGRIAASNTIDNIAAAGVDIRKTILYPGDRGLGNEGQPVLGTTKIADKVFIWGIQADLDNGRADE